jgi:ribosomal protein L24E
VLHRFALTITRRQPYADWASGESAGEPDAVAYSDELPRTIYLVPAVGSPSVSELLDQFWSDIFEEELEAWSEDEASWPGPRTRELFDLWFAAELTDTVVDLAPDEPLTEADMELASMNDALLHCAWCDLELEPGEGRRVGFKVADRELLADREGLALWLVAADEHVLAGIVTARDSEAAANGDDLFFRACTSRCEKLIRKEVPRALRRLQALP